MLFNTLTRFKLIQFMVICLFTTTLIACSGGSGSSSQSATNESITISSFTESYIAINESTTATVSLNSSTWGNSPVTVTIINNNSNIIDLHPTNCYLTKESNTCNLIITGIAGGDASFSASAKDVPTATSNTLTVNLAGVIFGDNAGLLYMNNTILPGASQTTSIDGNVLNGAVITSNNNIYVATSGGKVYNYNESSSLWVTVPGTGAGYTLDGSSINVLKLNNSNIYAGTSNGNLFVYSNNQWNRISVSINTPIQTLAFDQDNNPYIGTQSGQVFELVNSNWVNLTPNDSVDTHGTIINALAISGDNKLYAATGYNDPTLGQVYLYNRVNNEWLAISSFDDQSVNTLVIFNNILYAGINIDNTTGNVQQYNGGSSWTQLTHQPGTTPVNILQVNNNILYAATLGTQNTDPIINGQVYRYNNNIWDKISTLSNGQVTALAINNGYFYAGTNPDNNFNIRTLYKYTESIGQWSPVGGVDSVDSSSIIFSTAVDSSGSFYVGSLYNVYKYNSTIKSWLPIAVNSFDNSGISSIATYNGITYAVTFAGNVLYNYNSTDWTIIKTFTNGQNIFSATDSAGKLYIGNNFSTDNTIVGTVWQYNNTLNSWRLLIGNGESGSLDGSTLQSIATDHLNNVYAGTDAGLIWEYPEGGSSWQLVGIGAPDGSQINSITIDKNNYLYVGTGEGNVYQYNGIIWSGIGVASVDGSSVNTVTFDSAGILYAITNTGNVWQYSFNTNIWTNKYYGNGILLGSNTTPTAAGF